MNGTCLQAARESLPSGRMSRASQRHWQANSSKTKQTVHAHQPSTCPNQLWVMPHTIGWPFWLAILAGPCLPAHSPGGCGAQSRHPGAAATRWPCAAPPPPAPASLPPAARSPPPCNPLAPHTLKFAHALPHLQKLLNARQVRQQVWRTTPLPIHSLSPCGQHARGCSTPVATVREVLLGVSTSEPHTPLPGLISLRVAASKVSKVLVQLQHKKRHTYEEPLASCLLLPSV